MQLRDGPVAELPGSRARKCPGPAQAAPRDLSVDSSPASAARSRLPGGPRAPGRAAGGGGGSQEAAGPAEGAWLLQVWPGGWTGVDSQGTNQLVVSRHLFTLLVFIVF